MLFDCSKLQNYLKGVLFHSLCHQTVEHPAQIFIKDLNIPRLTNSKTLNFSFCGKCHVLFTFHLSAFHLGCLIRTINKAFKWASGTQFCCIFERLNEHLKTELFVCNRLELTLTCRRKHPSELEKVVGLLWVFVYCAICHLHCIFLQR